MICQGQALRVPDHFFCTVIFNTKFMEKKIIGNLAKSACPPEKAAFFFFFFRFFFLLLKIYVKEAYFKEQVKMIGAI
jgi:hypothetical protein